MGLIGELERLLGKHKRHAKKRSAAKRHEKKSGAAKRRKTARKKRR